MAVDSQRDRRCRFWFYLLGFILHV